jgi:hypothetical protein
MYENFKENLNLCASKAIGDVRAAAHAVFSGTCADAHIPLKTDREIFMDTRGFTYHSVRFCDLDLIRDK